MLFGSQIFRLDNVESTNNFAAKLIEQRLCENGALILADIQTAGKGQRDAIWESDANKNLLCSYVYFPDNMSVDSLALYNCCFSLAVITALSQFGIDATIKWPNDILIKNKKVAGILIENEISQEQIKSMIFGLGLNVNQLSFNYHLATSMAIVQETSYDLKEVSVSITNEFNHWVSFIKKNSSWLKTQYLNHLYGYQKLLRFKILSGEVEGTITGVNDRGELEVELQGKVETFRNKELSFLL